MRVLVLNCGSSSLKFQVVECDDAGVAAARGARCPRGIIERIGDAAHCQIVDGAGTEREETRALRTHEAAAQLVFGELASANPPCGIDAVGHRIVHGGDRFRVPVRIDAAVLSAIDALTPLAPLHNPAAISGIRAARAACGTALPMVAVFDTAFHHTMPDHAAHYALPAELMRRHGIRRYGFHGIAHQSLALRYREIGGADAAHAKLITLHLGNGCSAAAIAAGRSLDTSMGFTPLEGLMMGTRSGDIDPAVVGYLMRREGVDADTVETWLNQDSGLLGVSGRSNDLRELIGVMDHDAAARLAVEMFCYRIGKCVGAYLVALGGADALIFSGGIGEHSPLVRERVCERLQWCGLRLDPQRNAETVGCEGRISADGALHAYVIPADEEGLIAQETQRCLRGE